MSRISIVGTGYVGLVTGACLAERGHEVTCIDIDPLKVDQINAGRAPFFEHGIDQLLARNARRRLHATTDLRSAVVASDLTYIAVGTPAMGGRIDLTDVVQAAQQVGNVLRDKADYHLVVVKSTVIPGTTDGEIRAALERASGKRAGVDFGLGMNPEFLTEGSAVADFMNPDRLVFGGIDDRSRQLLAAVYKSFDDVPCILTGNATAEMIKYASNSVLAAMISFANELGRLCRALGNVDIADVMRGVHCSGYFSTRMPDGGVFVAPITHFLEAGCGFGGSCLPKDVTALAAQGNALGLPMPMLRALLDINRTQPDELVRLVTDTCPTLTGVPVTVLGIAFKPETDDVRESPAFPVLNKLRQLGATLTAYDPVAWPAGHEALSGVRRATSLQDALETAAIVVLVTRWSEFLAVPKLLESMKRTPLVVDGRRMLDSAACEHYAGIGRGRNAH